MELSSSQKQTIQHQFDCICKRVLADEAKDYLKEICRRAAHETTFSELSEQEMNQLYTMDKYFSEDQFFNVLGYDVAIKDGLIAEALRLLPEQRRDIILLFYFLEMTDKEIGEVLNLVRSTVQYQRTRSLEQLKKLMEDGQAYDENK